jgi:hypothetical protein
LSLIPVATVIGPEVQKFLANGNAGADAAAIAKSIASQETKLILEEVNILVEKYKDLPYQVWREELVKRCQRLRQVVKDNIPQSWEALE